MRQIQQFLKPPVKTPGEDQIAAPEKNGVPAPGPTDRNMANETPTKSGSSETQPPTEVMEQPEKWSFRHIGSTTNEQSKLVQKTKPKILEISASATGFSKNGDNLFYMGPDAFSKLFSASIILDTSKPNPEDSLVGVMVRESDDPKSPFVFIGVSPTRKMKVLHRNKTGQYQDEIKLPDAPPEGPVYFKVEQGPLGATLTYSFDGKKFEPIRHPNLPFDVPQFRIGLAISSGSVTKTVRASFTIHAD